MTSIQAMNEIETDRKKFDAFLHSRDDKINYLCDKFLNVIPNAKKSELYNFFNERWYYISFF